MHYESGRHRGFAISRGRVPTARPCITLENAAGLLSITMVKFHFSRPAISEYNKGTTFGLVRSADIQDTRDN
jgi:hypothetical protein